MKMTFGLTFLNFVSKYKYHAYITSPYGMPVFSLPGAFSLYFPFFIRKSGGDDPIIFFDFVNVF